MPLNYTARCSGKLGFDSEWRSRLVSSRSYDTKPDWTRIGNVVLVRLSPVRVVWSVVQLYGIIANARAPCSTARALSHAHDRVLWFVAATCFKAILTVEVDRSKRKMNPFFTAVVCVYVCVEWGTSLTLTHTYSPHRSSPWQWIQRAIRAISHGGHLSDRPWTHSQGIRHNKRLVAGARSSQCVFGWRSSGQWASLIALYIDRPFSRKSSFVSRRHSAMPPNCNCHSMMVIECTWSRPPE